MAGYFYLTMVIFVNGGVSQHMPNGNLPFTWEQCQKAGQFNTATMRTFRNVSVNFYCAPGSNAIGTLPPIKE